jgi:[acyl-carrier-protein] S-malonyltransferase
MGKSLYDRFDSVKDLFAKANEVLGFDLARITFEGPMEDLTKTNICQPAIFTVSMAVLKALVETHGLDKFEPGATAGLSLGEYSALVFAKVIPFEDAIKIVERRGAFMQEACDANPSAMASIIGLDAETCEKIAAELSAGGGELLVANYNEPKQHVFSGDIPLVEQACEKATEAGARRAIKLKVAGAYHSSYMTPAREKLAPFIDEVAFAKPEVPFFSNVTGQFEDDPERIMANLISQVDSPVRWAQTLLAINEKGISEFLELGPGKSIGGMLKRTVKSSTSSSLCELEDIESLGK